MRRADPITDDATAYYAEAKKSLKKSVTLGNKQAALEPEKWTDKVFVADNVETTAKLA